MSFNAGDRVKLIGTVKESVTDHASTRTSVLIGTEESPGTPSVEYWVNAANLVAAGTAAAEAAASAPPPPETPAPTEAPTASKTKAHA